MASKRRLRRKECGAKVRFDNLQEAIRAAVAVIANAHACRETIEIEAPEVL